jgi:hypothetical protein
VRLSVVGRHSETLEGRVEPRVPRHFVRPLEHDSTVSVMDPLARRNPPRPTGAIQTCPSRKGPVPVVLAYELLDRRDASQPQAAGIGGSFEQPADQGPHHGPTTGRSRGISCSIPVRCQPDNAGRISPRTRGCSRIQPIPATLSLTSAHTTGARTRTAWPTAPRFRMTADGNRVSRKAPPDICDDGNGLTILLDVDMQQFPGAVAFVAVAVGPARTDGRS